MSGAGLERSMLSVDQPAALSSRLLVAKDIAAAHAAGSSSPESVSPASLAADPILPEDVTAEQHGDDPDAADVDMASPPAVALFRKGAASAAGFRPGYWSYDREANAPATAGPSAVVMPFSSAAVIATPAVADEGAAVVGPIDAAPPQAATATPAVHARQSSRRLLTDPVVLFGCLAVTISATLFLLTEWRRGADAVVSRPILSTERRVAPLQGGELVTSSAPARREETPGGPNDDAPGSARQVVDSQPASPVSSQEIENLIARGDRLIATGDIAAARLFYERAVEQGSSTAATSVGKTFDPLFLVQVHARGIRADRAAAAAWYRRANAAGDYEAGIRLKRLITKFSP